MNRKLSGFKRIPAEQGAKKEKSDSLYMPMLKPIFTLDEEIYGYYPCAKEWICFSGKFIISRNKTLQVKLKLNMEYISVGLDMVMPEKKIITSQSVTEVYAKLSKWFLSYDVLFKS